jgi:basic membrane lipoprotein Med (substrate-binding protein (PBP1-ABC) superfamily)
MSGEMIKRVAQAIEDARNRWQSKHGYGIDRNFGGPYDVLARAAIEAMRELTEEMEDKVDDVFHEVLEVAKRRQSDGKAAFNSAAFVGPIWNCLIDEALK